MPSTKEGTEGEHMNFSQRLKSARKKAGYTGKEFAIKLGISYNTYITYENGSREPKQETLIKIADLLQVSIDSLLGVVVLITRTEDLDNILLEFSRAVHPNGFYYKGKIILLDGTGSYYAKELTVRINELRKRIEDIAQEIEEKEVHS